MYSKNGASLVAQLVKNLPATKDTWAPSLGWEDPLEKGMATYSNILAWRISWAGEPDGLHGISKSQNSPWGRKKLDTTE